MFDLKWSRKAATWDEVRADARALKVAEGLPVYPAGIDGPMDYFSGERPTVFLVQTLQGDLFLVDQQGYGYCRYAVRIPGLRIPPAAGPCGECNGTGKLTRIGGDWGRPDEEVICWKCNGSGK